MSIKITKEMFDAAVREAQRREDDGQINHHFSLEHMSDYDRNILGFLGEFAGREELGLDWRFSIRDNYLKPDNGDVFINKQIIDIKTETIPKKYFWNIVKRKYSKEGKEECKRNIDDIPFGRRLICKDQVDLLQKYDYVLWCAFIREHYEDWINNGYPSGNAMPDCYCLGYLDTQHIINNYSVVSKAPFGIKYPIPGVPVRTSELEHIVNLKKLLK